MTIFAVGCFYLVCEIVFTSYMAGYLGFFYTFLLIIGSLFAGAKLFSYKIKRLIAKANSSVFEKSFLNKDVFLNDVNESLPNSGNVFESILFLLACVLLIIPGFLGDIIALVLMINKVRFFIAKKIQNKFSYVNEYTIFDGNNFSSNGTMFNFFKVWVKHNNSSSNVRVNEDIIFEHEPVVNREQIEANNEHVNDGKD